MVVPKARSHSGNPHPAFGIARQSRYRLLKVPQFFNPPILVTGKAALRAYQDRPIAILAQATNQTVWQPSGP
jgi:hypothetical protein